MTDLALNILSGLVGALFGAFIGIYAVRYSHVLQAEAALRNLLVAQRIAVRMLRSEETQKQLQSDFLAIYQAYQNLRSVAGWRRRSMLDAAWRNYKGNYEDVMPLFGEQTVEFSEISGKGTCEGYSFRHEEVSEKIENFLKCLG